MFPLHPYSVPFLLLLTVGVWGAEGGGPEPNIMDICDSLLSTIQPSTSGGVAIGQLSAEVADRLFHLAKQHQLQETCQNYSQKESVPPFEQMSPGELEAWIRQRSPLTSHVLHRIEELFGCLELHDRLLQRVAAWLHDFFRDPRTQTHWDLMRQPQRTFGDIYGMRITLGTVGLTTAFQDLLRQFCSSASLEAEDVGHLLSHQNSANDLALHLLVDLFWPSHCPSIGDHRVDPLRGEMEALKAGALALQHALILRQLELQLEHLSMEPQRAHRVMMLLTARDAFLNHLSACGLLPPQPCMHATGQRGISVWKRIVQSLRALPDLWTAKVGAWSGNTLQYIAQPTLSLSIHGFWETLRYFAKHRLGLRESNLQKALGDETQLASFSCLLPRLIQSIHPDLLDWSYTLGLIHYHHELAAVGLQASDVEAPDWDLHMPPKRWLRLKLSHMSVLDPFVRTVCQTLLHDKACEFRNSIRVFATIDVPPGRLWPPVGIPWANAKAGVAGDDKQEMSITKIVMAGMPCNPQHPGEIHTCPTRETTMTLIVDTAFKKKVHRSVMACVSGMLLADSALHYTEQDILASIRV
jgi:hypothetical protein